MKISIYVLVLLCLLVSCQKKQVSESIPEDEYKSEVEAIKTVIIGESRTFWAKDYNAWADHWTQEDYVRVTGWWQRGGITVHEG